MATSGTYDFAPAFSDFVINAFARIQVRPAAFSSDHLINAAAEGNFLLSEWSNKQPNLWTSETVTQILTEGQATYTLSATTIAILIAYIQTGSGDSQSDRVLGPLSTTEYFSIPNKTQEGQPTSYWFNRQVTPQITLWQPPDGNGPYTLVYQRVRQVQDSLLANGTAVEVPYRWYDAYTAGLAHRLARIYAPSLEGARKADAQEAWQIAATQDTEAVNMAIIPGLNSYYR